MTANSTCKYVTPLLYLVCFSILFGMFIERIIPPELWGCDTSFTALNDNYASSIETTISDNSLDECGCNGVKKPVADSFTDKRASITTKKKWKENLAAWLVRFKRLANSNEISQANQTAWKHSEISPRVIKSCHQEAPGWIPPVVICKFQKLWIQPRGNSWAVWQILSRLSHGLKIILAWQVSTEECRSIGRSSTR